MASTIGWNSHFGEPRLSDECSSSCPSPAPASVKGCRTPARAHGKASIFIGLRAGVGQASREETAGHAAVAISRAVYGDWAWHSR